LNSILFLMTPAVVEGKTAMLLAALERFTDLYEADAPLARVVPRLCVRLHARYGGYSLGRLCQEMHDFLRTRNVKELQRLSFRYESFPEQAMTVFEEVCTRFRDSPTKCRACIRRWTMGGCVSTPRS
jgi:ornithine decarboxylase